MDRKFALKLLFLLNIVIYFNYCLAADNNDDAKTATDYEQNSKSPNEDCKYDKGSWQACDPVTGSQKRILKLKATQDLSMNCPSEKFLERPCKRQCKYIKGPWSDCKNGNKERIDKLRSQVSSSDCKLEKIVNKVCKKQCNYEKSDWSSCENGIKTKKLILKENSSNNVDCEPVRNITKSCSSRNSKLKKNSRRKNKNQH